MSGQLMSWLDSAPDPASLFFLMRPFLRVLCSFSAVLFCALAIGPPPGFALCVDTDGHLVIETGDAAQGMCCLPGTEGRPNQTCQPDDCVTCVDYVISASDALRANGSTGVLPNWTLTAIARLDAAPAPTTFCQLSAPVVAPPHPGASAPTPLRL